jgi:A/G-specific adenine glycosylase
MGEPPLELREPIADFASSLLRWYSANRRSLPWRERPEPYRVWIAEVMLQQTTVKAVLPYYERFLARFPDVATLAGADEADVLAGWAGLGYYSRARNLLKTARTIQAKHGGEFPSDYEAVLALPGIGRYTAGAILSIAFGAPRPVLDGNVARVFARYLGLQEEWNGAASTRLWGLLEELVQDPTARKEVADFNQALMELGATVCVPRQPECRACPLGDHCAARSLGRQEEIPKRARPRRLVALDFTVAVVRSGQRLLMCPTGSAPFPKDFWEPPRIPGLPSDDIGERFRSNLGLRLEIGPPLGVVFHTITHHRLRLHAVDATLTGALPKGFTWIEPQGRAVALSTYVKKILRLL